MKRPIIGIIGKVQPQYGEDIWHRIDEVDEIRYLIVKNGGTAIMLLPTEITLKFNDNDILVSSEIKALLLYGIKPQMGLDEIAELITLAPSSSPGKTLYKNIYEVKPGYYLKFSRKGIKVNILSLRELKIHFPMKIMYQWLSFYLQIQ